MISKEEFIETVKSSVQYSATGHPYLIIDDSTLICPFCEKELEFKNNTIKCDCKKSIDFSTKFMRHKTEIADNQNFIKIMENNLNQEALRFFKEYYRNIMLYEIHKEIDTLSQEISSIKEI